MLCLDSQQVGNYIALYWHGSTITLQKHFRIIIFTRGVYTHTAHRLLTPALSLSLSSRQLHTVTQFYYFIKSSRSVLFCVCIARGVGEGREWVDCVCVGLIFLAILLIPLFSAIFLLLLPFPNFLNYDIIFDEFLIFGMTCFRLYVPDDDVEHGNRLLNLIKFPPYIRFFHSSLISNIKIH